MREDKLKKVHSLFIHTHLHTHLQALNSLYPLCSSKAPAPAQQQKKKESIIDLAKYMDKSVRVKFSGGREGMHKRGSAVINLFYVY